MVGLPFLFFGEDSSDSRNICGPIPSQPFLWRSELELRAIARDLPSSLMEAEVSQDLCEEASPFFGPFLTLERLACSALPEAVCLAAPAVCWVGYLFIEDWRLGKQKPPSHQRWCPWETRWLVVFAHCKQQEELLWFCFISEVCRQPRKTKLLWRY